MYRLAIPALALVVALLWLVGEPPAPPTTALGPRPQLVEGASPAQAPAPPHSLG